MIKNIKCLIVFEFQAKLFGLQDLFRLVNRKTFLLLCKVITRQLSILFALCIINNF